MSTARASASEQLRDAHQIVGGGGKGELPTDPDAAAMTSFAQASDRLDPTETFLDPLADALTDLVAGVARGAAVNCGAAAVGVLSDMRCNHQTAHLGNEVVSIEQLVRAHRDASAGRTFAE